MQRYRLASHIAPIARAVAVPFLSLALGCMLFFGSASDVEARREVSAICKWFGTAPACNGSCPRGWTQTMTSKTGEGQRCFTGSKVRCCDFQERCVPDYDSSFDPNNKRILPNRTVQCQRCIAYGEDCKSRGGFNTACKRWEWVDCGKAPPPLTNPGQTGQGSQGKKPIGSPILAPDPNPPAPSAPACTPPHITASNGACICPAGTTGANCQNPIVH